MKKLSKMKLKDFHELADYEMKNVIGGHESSYGPRCNIGGSCVLKIFDEYFQQTGSKTGECQQQVSGNDITCFCDAGEYNTPLINQSGMSHCWVKD